MPAQSMNNEQISTGSRLVWICNKDSVEYREDYNGSMIVIPPNGEKKVKMPFLEARKFLGRGKPAARQLPDGTYIIRPKALYTEEISEELEKEQRKLKGDDAVFKCMICNKEFEKSRALAMHVMKSHPDAEPASNPD